MTISSTPTAAEINVELGRAASAPFSINGAEERALAQVPTGPISFADFIGKSAEYNPVFVANNGGAWITAPQTISRDVSKWIMSVWVIMGNFLQGAPVFMQRVSNTIHGFQPYTNFTPVQGVESFHGGTTIGANRAQSPADTWAQKTFHHMLVCYDSSRLSADKIRFYLDDQLIPMGSLSGISTTYDGLVQFLRDPNGTENLNALAISDLYVNYGESLDLDIEANRRKFSTADNMPVDLGADGSTPTGTQPDFYFGRNMRVADWNNGVNLGSDAQTLTVNGTFTVGQPLPERFEYTMTAGLNGNIIGFSAYDGTAGSLVPAQFEGINVTRMCDTISTDGYLRFSLGSADLPVDFCTKVEIEGITDPNWSGGRRVFYPALNDLFISNETGNTAWYWTFATRFVNGHQYRVRLSNADPRITSNHTLTTGQIDGTSYGYQKS